MFRSTIGAQRASSRMSLSAAAIRGGRWVGLALTGSMIAGLALAPTVGASTATIRPAAASTTVALTTTAVDKPWYSLEQFSLGLVNCDRTGGWILADGTCHGEGGRVGVAPSVSGRAVDERQPLAEHQERQIRQDRDRRLALRQPDSTGPRLLRLTPLRRQSPASLTDEARAGRAAVS